MSRPLAPNVPFQVPPKYPLVEQWSGVDLNNPLTLLRLNATRMITHNLVAKRMGILCAPSGSGKTSILRLLQHYLQNQYPAERAAGGTPLENGGQVECHVVDFSLSARHPRPHDYLYGSNGIHPEGLRGLLKEPAFPFVEKYILVDEAHFGYLTLQAFWLSLKNLLNQFNSRIRVLIVASYGSNILTPFVATPLEFPFALGPDVMQFTDVEVQDVVDRFSRLSNLPSSQTLAAVIKQLTSGCPYLVLTILFATYEKLKKIPVVSESMVLSALGSAEVFHSVMNCRSIARLVDVNGEEMSVINKVLFGTSVKFDNTDPVHLNLMKRGFFTPSSDLLRFSSPLQQIYIFTKFGNTSPLQPVGSPSSDIRSFVLEALQLMNPVILRESLGRSGSGILLERAWQMEGYRSLVAALGDTGLVSPDVGSMFPAGGFVDFYVNGARGWMIEYLREGNKLIRHLSRFVGSGPYTRIPHMDYLVVDFRAKAPNTPIQDDRLWIVHYDPDFFAATVYQKTTSPQRIVFQGTVDFREKIAQRWLGSQ